MKNNTIQILDHLSSVNTKENIQLSLIGYSSVTQLLAQENFITFVGLLCFVSLMENCNEFLDSTIRINFEMPSAIVPLPYVVSFAAKLILLIRLSSMSIKYGFGSNKESFAIIILRVLKAIIYRKEQYLRLFSELAIYICNYPL